MVPSIVRLRACAPPVLFIYDTDKQLRVAASLFAAAVDVGERGSAQARLLGVARAPPSHASRSVFFYYTKEALDHVPERVT